jgi:hypothetical protein
MTPTTLTLRALRDEGYLADVAERRIPRTHITHDLFGCCDIVALRKRRPRTLGVQATDSTHFANRLTKVLASESLPVMFDARWVVEVWGWRPGATREQGRERYSARVARIERSASGETVVTHRDHVWVRPSATRRPKAA